MPREIHLHHGWGEWPQARPLPNCPFNLYVMNGECREVDMPLAQAVANEAYTLGFKYDVRGTIRVWYFRLNNSRNWHSYATRPSNDPTRPPVLPAMLEEAIRQYQREQEMMPPARPEPLEIRENPAPRLDRTNWTAVANNPGWIVADGAAGGLYTYAEDRPVRAEEGEWELPNNIPHRLAMLNVRLAVVSELHVRTHSMLQEITEMRDRMRNDKKNFGPADYRLLEQLMGTLISHRDTYARDIQTHEHLIEDCK